MKNIYRLSLLMTMLMSTSAWATNVETDIGGGSRSVAPPTILEKTPPQVSSQVQLRQLEAIQVLESRAGQGRGIVETLEAMTGVNKAVDNLRRLTAGMPKTERSKDLLNAFSKSLQERRDIYNSLQARLWDFKVPKPAISYEAQLNDNYARISTLKKAYLKELGQNSKIKSEAFGYLRDELDKMTLGLELQYENLIFSMM